MGGAEGLGGPKCWQDILDSIKTLADLIQTCKDAFGEDEAAPKVSATTKKRLTVRAMQGLQGGSELFQALAANLRQLQQAAEHQQQEVQEVADSNADLQQQLQGSSDECHSSKRALLLAESQKLAVKQQMQQLQKQLQAATDDKQQLQDTIGHLQAELQNAAKQAAEAAQHMQQLQQQMGHLAAAAQEAEAGADAAAGALEAAREEASRERAARLRHEDAVARLTADNLVFMAKLRAAEATTAAATAERDELRLALEQHKGPWMDQVHQGVEVRVKSAMALAEQLEARLQLAEAQHAQHTQQMQQQQADLEAALQDGQQQVSELRQQALAAQAAASEARTAAEEAAVLAATAQAAADERAAELRVAQDSLRSMREECNERWMSERAARAQLVQLQSQLSSKEAAASKLKQKLQARSDDLATQRAVNQQLMLKKEEVEWQLLAAIAQVQHHQAAVTAPGSGSIHSVSPQSLLDSKQQQQQQQHTAPPAVIATSPASPTAAAATATGIVHDEEHLTSPFGASAHLPLSPVQTLHPTADLALPSAMPQKPSAAGAAATSRPEVPGPAVIAAGGGLWQLPGGSSSGLFGSGRVSSSGGDHPLAVIGSNLMPAATAAAVGAMIHGKSGLHHAFSCPEGNMYSFPPLGFGLAMLPSTEQLIAAAEAAAHGSGSLQKTVTIGRAGSLTVPMPSDAHMLHGRVGNTDPAANTISTGAAGVPVVTVSSVGHEGCSSGSVAVGPGPGVGLTFRPAPVQPIMLGPTGGLMAPFSPLSPGSKGPSSSVSRGAVFPECITASAVTDAEQAELGCFSFAPGAGDALQPGQQQQQQHVLGPGFWYLQQQQHQLQQQQHPQQPQQQQHPHGSNGSLSDGGHPVHHSSSLCASSGSLHELHGQQPAQAGVDITNNGPAVDTADAAVAAATAFAAAAGSAVEPDQRDSNDSSHSGGSNGGSNAHVHGILLNGPNSSRTRSPAIGVSPSGSMKSVRFSFEGLDSSQGMSEDVQQEQQQDQKGGRHSHTHSRSGSHSLLSTSPPTRSSGTNGRSSSEWLRHTLYEQLSQHSLPGSGNPQHVNDHSRGSQPCRRQGSRDGSSRQLHGWQAASHPPAYGHRGAHYMGRFAQERQQEHADRLRQQQRQHRQQEAAKEVAALTAAAADRSQPRRAPVHPIFGAMQLPASAEDVQGAGTKSNAA